MVFVLELELVIELLVELVFELVRVVGDVGAPGPAVDCSSAGGRGCVCTWGW